MNEQKMQRGSVVKWASRTSNADKSREAAGSRDGGNVVGRKMRTGILAEVQRYGVDGQQRTAVV